MKVIVATLFVAVQIWTVASRAAPSATTAAPSTIPDFEQLLTQAKTNFNTMTEHVNEMLGLPKNADASNVLEVVKKNSDNWAKELSGLVEKLKNQVDTIKQGEVSETLKKVQEKLEKTAESLKKEIESPEVKAKTKQIQENFTKSLNTIVEEANKLSKTVLSDKTISEDIQKLSKQVVEQAVKASEQFQESLHQATGHKAEAHKH